MMTSLITRRLKFALLAVLACVCLLQAGGVARAQTQDFQVPQPTGNAVNDFAGVMDAETKRRLENILINLKREQQIEFAVVTVKTTEGREIFDYALAVARRWGIGPANDEKQGLLLIVAIDDRKYQTLVSRHLQGELTDGTVGSLQRQYLIPAFRAGNYGQGLMDTARSYIDTLAEKRGFSTASIYQDNQANTSQTPQSSRRRTNTGGGMSGCGLAIIIIIVLIVLFSSRGRGGGGSGCLNLLFLGSMLSGGSRGGWSSGGWSGGGFGGSSGGGGGGFGGFGGGGDFDGGGAGGSW
ncbi:MAG: TPM domain-containing protein [Acidobacteria bacterium]|nr:TPM domain-containing protein [Acidobacteriota bacterium]